MEVIGVALHSETEEPMVVYLHPDPIKSKEENTMWVRPLKMFEEEVEVNGQKVPRFKYMGQE